MLERPLNLEVQKTVTIDSVVLMTRKVILNFLGSDAEIKDPDERDADGIAVREMVAEQLSKFVQHHQRLCVCPSKTGRKTVSQLLRKDVYLAGADRTGVGTPSSDRRSQTCGER